MAGMDGKLTLAKRRWGPDEPGDKIAQPNHTEAKHHKRRLPLGLAAIGHCRRQSPVKFRRNAIPMIAKADRISAKPNLSQSMGRAFMVAGSYDFEMSAMGGKLPLGGN